MNFDIKYLVCALSFAAVGLSLGVYMGASHNHSELVAHAHILLIGFVVSFIYAIIHRLWLVQPNRAIATAQFVLHLVAAITISVGLFLLYGNIVEAPALDLILGIGAVGVLLGMLMMIYMVIKFGHRQSVA
jgi:hypothetical protein